MFRLNGVSEVLNNLRAFMLDLTSNLTEELDSVTNDALNELKIRTSQAYQTVPSYLPPDSELISTFSKKAPPVQDTVWEGMVQEYFSGAHKLHDLLTSIISVDDDGVMAEIGYEEGVGSTVGTKYIVDVLFGTRIMQGRNFLAVLLKDYEDAYYRAALSAGLRTVNGR